MRKILIYSLMIILLVSIAVAIPLTTIENDKAKVKYIEGTIEQYPSLIKSTDEALITLNTNDTTKKYNLCFEFPIDTKDITIDYIKKKKLLIDKNLKDVIKTEKKLCVKQFSDDGEIYYKMSYNGIGTIKYNVTIDNGKEVMVLDPYIIGDLKNKTLIHFPFDGNIDATTSAIGYVTSVNATSTSYTTDWTNPTNAFDNNWATYATAAAGLGYNFLYMNYTKHENMTNANWIAKDEAGTRTIPISEDCLTAYTDILRLRILLYKPGYVHTLYYCYDGSNWEQLKDVKQADTANKYFYEESINWTVTIGATTALNASYHIFGSQGYDFKLLGASTDIFGTDDGVDTDMSYTGAGAVFNGSGYVDLGSNGFEESICDNGCSFCTWFETNDASARQILVARYDSTDNDRFLLFRVNTGAKVQFFVNSDGVGANNVVINTDVGTVLDNTWHHACAVYNGTNTTDGNATLYLDNVLKGTSTQSMIINSTAWADDENMYIGRYDDGVPTILFNGTMRSTFIYDRAITATEVSQLYTNGSYVNNSIDEANSAISFFDSSIKDGIRLPSATTYDLKGGATFAFWADGETTSTKYVLGYSTTDGTRTLTLYNSNAGLYFETNNNGDTCYARVTQDDEWHHYVLKVLDYECSMYEDGVALTMVDNVVTDNVTFDMIGGPEMEQTFAYTFDGGLDELMLFDYALSLTEIQTLSGGYENAINITVRDEATNEIIPLVSVTYYNDNLINTVNTINGVLFITGLAPGAYFWTISSDNYTSRKYNFVVQTNQSIIQQENAYLTKETNTVIFTYKNKITGRLLEDVNITISSFVGDELVVLENTQTDISGRVEFSFTEGSRYIFDSVKNGYINKSFELNPIIFTSYTIEMDPTTTIEDSIQGLGISTIYVPHRFSYNDTRTLNYTISSPGGTLINYSLNITYNGVSSVYNGTTATGETLNHTYNLSNISAEYFIVSYDYYSVETGYKSFSYPYRVLIINNSANNTLENMRANAYGIGLFERVLIVVVSSIVTAGIVSFAAGPVAGGAAGLLLMGAFVYLKLISIWLIIIPLIVGFILIVKGSG